MNGFLPPTRTGAFLGLAVLLVGLPFLALPVVMAGRLGLASYLTISDAYFRLPAMVFGGGHFARREFGMIPTSTLAYLLAAMLYAGIAFLLCWLVPLRRAVPD